MDGSKTQGDLLDTGWHDQPLAVSRLVAIARRQAWLVILAVVLAVMAGGAYIVLAVPFYTASARIYADVDTTDGTPAGALVQLDTHVELIQSDRTTEAVIEDLGLEGLFSAEPGLLRRTVTRARGWLDLDNDDDPEAPLDEHTATIRGVESGLYVERVANTAIIDISYTTTSKQLAVAIANSYASNYIAEVADRAQQTARRRVRQLQERADAIGKQAAAATAEAQALRFRSALAVADAEDLQRRTADLAQRLSAADAEAAAAKGRRAVLAAPADLAALPPEALQTPEALALAQGLAAADARLAAARADADAPATTLARLETSRDQLATALGAELQRAADTLDVSLAEIAAREASLRAELDALTAYARSPEWAELLDAERKAAIYQDMYGGYLNDLENAYRQVPRRSEVRMISEALPPYGPSLPRYKVVLALMVTIGLMAGVALAVYREWNRSLPPGAYR